MDPGQQSLYITRSEYEKDRDILKCDLKELINQERSDRKEGETELNNGIKRMESKLESMNSRLSEIIVTLFIAIIVAVLEFLLGKA
jgi:hypothetical protein